MIDTEFLLVQRTSKNLTRRFVASELGISEGTLYQIETGKLDNPSSRIIGNLANFYGVTTDSILGREQE